MLFSERSAAITVLIIFLVGCGQTKNKNEDVVDSTSQQTVAQSNPESEPVDTTEYSRGTHSPQFIQFSGTARDEVHARLATFPAFDEVYRLATEYTRAKDSLINAHQIGGEAISDPKDTLLLSPYKERAYQAIINYKKKLATRAFSRIHVPTLLDLTRVTDAGDSSLQQLPDAGRSDLLTAGNFFFIGGAPFISQLSPTDGTNYFTDREGKPETRFGMTLQDNLIYLLSSVYNNMPTAINVKYGPPLHTYDMGPIEVHGIGSLIHEFAARVPAFFITEGGLVPVHLLSVDLELGESYSCGTGPAKVEFACSRPVDERDIVGIYIPFGASPASCTFARPSNNIWTADLDNDGIADFACVANNYIGEMDYEIVETLWYANINGKWQIIDWAEIPECT